jgi:hypothetical protein
LDLKYELKLVKILKMKMVQKLELMLDMRVGIEMVDILETKSNEVVAENGINVRLEVGTEFGAYKLMKMIVQKM